MTRHRLALLAALLPAVLVALPAAGDSEDLCARAAARIEPEAGVPRGLMQAIALAESGRWIPARRESRAWPWTVTAGTNSFRLDGPEEAIATVRRLQAEGRRNIDVGCMQVNLMHHPDAFADLEAAFDPDTNVAYAAAFLGELRERTRSWTRAIAHYHSADPERGRSYRARVLRLWQAERRGAAETRRAALQERRPDRPDAPVSRRAQAQAALERLRARWHERRQAGGQG